MMKAKRRKFISVFKASVVLEALKERESLSELAVRFDVHAHMITKWKSEFIENASMAFDREKDETVELDQDKLYAKTGRLELENDFLKKSLGRSAR